jgi:hypothetical protein
MNSLIKTLSISVLLSFCFEAKAVVTYANCPTLAPLPVTSFLPAAMLPIKNAEMTFDIGMNQIVRSAVTMATQLQLQAIDSSFNSVMQNMIEISQAEQQNKMDVQRRYQEMRMAYKSELANQNALVKGMMFPNDPSMLPNRSSPVEVGGEVTQIKGNSTNRDGASYRYFKFMCSSNKMSGMLTSKKVAEKSIENKSRRSQKITADIQAIGSIDVAAKTKNDLHYDLFCSGSDLINGLCEEESLMPNADLDGFIFLYPSGYSESEGGATDDYRTMYTYSSVESLAAYQYIKNLSGTMLVAPPSNLDSNNPRKMKFAAAYKQFVAAMGMSADTLLWIAEFREPINSQGLVLGKLDAINYLIEKSKTPESRRTLKSASSSGKMVDIQRQLEVQHQLRLILYKQKDRLRLLEASKVAISNTLNLP